MTAVLPRPRPAADLRPARVGAPEAPERSPFWPQPADRSARYWDVAIPGWRPSPADDGC